MQKTKKHGLNSDNQLTINRQSLPAFLDCGMATASRIGELAGAKIVIGKRVLYSVPKIQAYLEQISGTE